VLGPSAGEKFGLSADFRPLQCRPRDWGTLSLAKAKPLLIRFNSTASPKGAGREGSSIDEGSDASLDPSLALGTLTVLGQKSQRGPRDLAASALVELNRNQVETAQASVADRNPVALRPVNLRGNPNKSGLTMRKPTLLLSFALILLLGGSLLHATLVPRMSVEQMIDDSELIVHGTVLRSWSGWDNARQFIWTHYELQVSDMIKGLPSVKLVVSEPGGIIGETAMQIAGAPQYEIGDEVVLFLHRTPIGYLRSSGWGQGKFGVGRPVGGGGLVVRSAVSGVSFVEARAEQPAGRQKVQTPVANFSGLALAEFKTRLRTLIRTRATGEGR